MLMRTAKSCGPGAPTRPDAGVKFCGAIREMTVARKPGHRGARRKPLKPLRGESRIDPVEPVVTTRVLSTFAHEAAGASDTRLSLRPLSLEGQ